HGLSRPLPLEPPAGDAGLRNLPQPAWHDDHRPAQAAPALPLPAVPRTGEPPRQLPERQRRPEQLATGVRRPDAGPRLPQLPYQHPWRQQPDECRYAAHLPPLGENDERDSIQARLPYLPSNRHRRVAAPRL